MCAELVFGSDEDQDTGAAIAAGAQKLSQLLQGVLGSPSRVILRCFSLECCCSYFLPDFISRG